MKTKRTEKERSILFKRTEKNGTFFYKERKRTERTERSFIKNGKEWKERNILLKRTDAQPCSTVRIPLRSQALRCASHHGVKLCGVHHTVESSFVVCITHWSQLHQISHKTLRCDAQLSVMHTAELSSAVCFSPRSGAPRCASHH